MSEKGSRVSSRWWTSFFRSAILLLWALLPSSVREISPSLTATRPRYSAVSIIGSNSSRSMRRSMVRVAMSAFPLYAFKRSSKPKTRFTPAVGSISRYRIRLNLIGVKELWMGDRLFADQLRSFDKVLIASIWFGTLAFPSGLGTATT